MLLSGELVFRFHETSLTAELLTHVADDLVEGVLYPTMITHDQSEDTVDPSGVEPFGAEVLGVGDDSLDSIVLREAMLATEIAPEEVQQTLDELISGEYILTMINSWIDDEAVQHTLDELTEGELVYVG
jgi:hypothetical protein